MDDNDRDVFDFSHLENDKAKKNGPAPPIDFPDRRRKKDWVSRAIPIMSLIGWIFAAVTIVLMDRAQPSTADLFTRMFNKPVYSSWNTQLVRMAFITIMLVFVVCAAAIVFNMLRHRRRSDKFNPSIIALGILSLIVLVIYIVNFAPYL